MDNTLKWADIWESRVHEPKKMSHTELLIANGYDSVRSALSTSNLVYAQDYYWSLIKLQNTDSVYEVGCGSGAFLYNLYQNNIKVGGMDLSNNLLDLAKINLPNGKWEQGNALSLNVEEKWDHVISFGLFLYFPDINYAEGVISKMLEKANNSVCIYDFPNLDCKDECEAMRRSTTPNYDRDYKNLQHLYYSKQWFIEFANSRNLHLTLFDQIIPEYASGKHRFCIILRKKM